MSCDYCCCSGISLVSGSVIVSLEDSCGIELRYQLGELVILALSTRYAAGYGVHGHDQKTYFLVLSQVILFYIIGKPLTICLTDYVCVDAYPGSQLLACFILQSVIGSYNRDSGLFTLGNNSLRHGLVRCTGNDTGCVVCNRVVNGLQVLFRVHLCVYIYELSACCLNSCLCGIALIQEPGLVARFVDTVNQQITVSCCCVFCRVLSCSIICCVFCCCVICSRRSLCRGLS